MSICLGSGGGQVNGEALATNGGSEEGGVSNAAGAQCVGDALSQGRGITFHGQIQVSRTRLQEKVAYGPADQEDGQVAVTAQSDDGVEGASKRRGEEG
jgi:hypothetical protein